jgi:O-antigen/teichoic acid export membrane protein
MKFDSRRRKELESVASLAAAQLAIGVSSLVRIPFVVRALGTEGYGIYFVLGNVAPVLLATGAGVRAASRAAAGEAQGVAERDRIVGASLAIALILAGVEGAALLGVPVVLPWRSWLSAGNLLSHAEVVGVLIGYVVICALAIPGGSAWGVLEAEGRQVFVHLVIGAVAVVGTAATVLLALLTDSLVAFSLLNVVTSALPFYVFLIAVLRDRSRRRQERHPPRSRLWRPNLHAAGRAYPPLAIRATDPFVIGAIIGPSAVAVYGLGQRLAVLNTLVVQATAPLLAASGASGRRSGQAPTRSSVLRTGTIQGALSLTVGLFLVAIGPWLSSVVSAGEIRVPRSIFIALASLGAAFSVAEAIASVANGPLGLKAAWRIDGVGMMVNLALSVVLARTHGVSGPIWASFAVCSAAVVAWIVVLSQDPAILTEQHLPDEHLLESEIDASG